MTKSLEFKRDRAKRMAYRAFLKGNNSELSFYAAAVILWLDAIAVRGSK